MILCVPISDGSYLSSVGPVLLYSNKMEPTSWFLHNLYSSSHEDMAVSTIIEADEYKNFIKLYSQIVHVARLSVISNSKGSELL
jgi:hypothetical protein